MNRPVHQSAWQILGIDSDADLTAIRRAYAAKLKIFRPDEDPVGFQRLREARDYAVRVLEYRLIEVTEDEDEEEGDGEPQAAADTHADPAPAVEAAAPAAAPAEPTLPAGNIATPEREPSHPLQTDAEPEPEPAHTPPATERTLPNAAAPAATQISAPPARPPSETLVPAEPARSAGTRALEAIEARFAATADRWNQAGWRHIMQLIAETGFYERPRIEWEIVRQLGELMRSDAWPALDRPPLSRRLLQPRAQHRADARARSERQARAFALRLIDEEFGWCRDDKLLYATLGPGLADRLADHVREARALDPAAHRQLVFPARRRPDGFPVLEERDLIAYLGSANNVYLSFYQGARRAGAYPMSWSFLGGVLPFFAQMRARRWLAGLGLFGASLLPAGAFINLAYAKHSLLALLPMLAQIAVHIAGGMYSKRWCIEGAATAIERADERGLVFASERARFLKRSGRIPALAILAGLVLCSTIEAEFIAGFDEPRKPPERSGEARRQADARTPAVVALSDEPTTPTLRIAP